MFRSRLRILSAPAFGASASAQIMPVAAFTGAHHEGFETLLDDPTVLFGCPWTRTFDTIGTQGILWGP